jgi:hypothetical protein
MFTAVYLLKEARVVFPDSQDFHYDSVPYPQGTSCKVIFAPRNKTVAISLYMANFVLSAFQVPEIKSFIESHSKFQGNVVVLIVELLKYKPQLSFQACVNSHCFERCHIQYRLMTACLFLIV